VKSLLRILLIFILSTPAFADDIYYLSDGKTRVEIPFKEVQNVLVNDVCSKNLNKCRALKVLKGKKQTAQLDVKKHGHEAGAYCKNVQGIQLNLLNESGSGMSFCAFKDHSLISSWDLFRAHHPEWNKK